MPYAINATNNGWRSINGESDILSGETYSATIPVLVPTLLQAQTAQIAVLTSSYQTAITAPVSFTTAAGTTAMFNQNDAAQTNLTKAMLESEKSGVWALNLWQDVNGTPITPFAYVDLQGLAAAMGAADLPSYNELLTLVGQVMAASTVEAVQAIVWS
jgi:hypothetical protein